MRHCWLNFADAVVILCKTEGRGQNSRVVRYGTLIVYGVGDYGYVSPNGLSKNVNGARQAGLEYTKENIGDNFSWSQNLDVDSGYAFMFIYVLCSPAAASRRLYKRRTSE